MKRKSTGYVKSFVIRNSTESRLDDRVELAAAAAAVFLAYGAKQPIEARDATSESELRACKHCYVRIWTMLANNGLESTAITLSAAERAALKTLSDRWEARTESVSFGSPLSVATIC